MRNSFGSIEQNFHKVIILYPSEHMWSSHGMKGEFLMIASIQEAIALATPSREVLQQLTRLLSVITNFCKECVQNLEDQHDVSCEMPKFLRPQL